MSDVLRTADNPRPSSPTFLSPPVAEPSWLSPTPPGTDISAAVKGGEMLQLPLFPQGENVARVLEARGVDGFPMYPTVGILMPRRSTKTTSIWNVLLGRCMLREGHKVVTTAQDGKRARNRFREVARILDRAGFVESGLGKIYWGNGDERLEFANGSSLWVVAPDAGSFRGEAADDMLFDESGELSVDKSEDLLAGALPLLDTRLMGQAIIAGTPSKARAGLLWDTLADGRAGEPATGIVDYSIRDDEESVLRDENGDVTGLNEEVLLRVHPGIGTLTTLAKMRSRYSKMGLPRFEMEYLCRFPFDNTTSAIDMDAWNLVGVPQIALPERVGLAFDVAPDSSSAALLAAWRDEHGVAYVGVLEHRQGVSWLARTANSAAKKYRTAVRYDGIGANHGPAGEIARLRGAKVEPGNGKDAQAAAQLLVSNLADGKLRHFDQGSLTSAAEGAAWRSSEGGRYFARKLSKNDISPLVAASLALYQYDLKPAPGPSKIITSSRR